MKGNVKNKLLLRSRLLNFFLAASLPLAPGPYSLAHTGCVKGGAHWFTFRWNPAAEAVDAE
jgi:hypothetical protein